MGSHAVDRRGRCLLRVAATWAWMPAGALPLGQTVVPAQAPPPRSPCDAVLGPGAFLVLYRQKTGIVLENGGDTVRLLDTSGREVDTVTFPEVGADASYNRSESGSWYASPLPSPDALNTVLVL